MRALHVDEQVHLLNKDKILPELDVCVIHEFSLCDISDRFSGMCRFRAAFKPTQRPQSPCYPYPAERETPAEQE